MNVALLVSVLFTSTIFCAENPSAPAVVLEMIGVTDSNVWDARISEMTQLGRFEEAGYLFDAHPSPNPGPLLETLLKGKDPRAEPLARRLATIPPSDHDRLNTYPRLVSKALLCDWANVAETLLQNGSRPGLDEYFVSDAASSLLRHFKLLETYSLRPKWTLTIQEQKNILDKVSWCENDCQLQSHLDYIELLTRFELISSSAAIGYIVKETNKIVRRDGAWIEMVFGCCSRLLTVRPESMQWYQIFGSFNEEISQVQLLLLPTAMKVGFCPFVSECKVTPFFIFSLLSFVGWMEAVEENWRPEHLPALDLLLVEHLLNPNGDEDTEEFIERLAKLRNRVTSVEIPIEDLKNVRNAASYISVLRNLIKLDASFFAAVFAGTNPEIHLKNIRAILDNDIDNEGQKEAEMAVFSLFFQFPRQGFRPVQPSS